MFKLKIHQENSSNHKISFIFIRVGRAWEFESSTPFPLIFVCFKLEFIFARLSNVFSATELNESICFGCCDATLSFLPHFVINLLEMRSLAFLTGKYTKSDATAEAKAWKPKKFLAFQNKHEFLIAAVVKESKLFCIQTFPADATREMSSKVRERKRKLTWICKIRWRF